MTGGNRGFTLIELMVTVSLLALLASAVVPFMQLSSQRNKEQELRLALREIRTAIDAYKKAADDGRVERTADESGYPKSLSLLVTGVIDLKDPRSRKIYFLRRLPRDPLASGELPAEETWGLRSYASEPDAPKAGDDVYDVYSLSEKVGLSGRLYREW
ncbi:MAG TPA: type II secretion system protein [Moraxellaceae bacterium]|nr:type II secretion system protein [Moraxellaceae bacterium]